MQASEWQVHNDWKDYCCTCTWPVTIIRNRTDIVILIAHSWIPSSSLVQVSTSYDLAGLVKLGQVGSECNTSSTDSEPVWPSGKGLGW